MVMYDKEFKQRKIKFRPRIKLNCKIYTYLFFAIVWRRLLIRMGNFAIPSHKTLWSSLQTKVNFGFVV